jgi:hypothetical protein
MKKTLFPFYILAAVAMFFVAPDRAKSEITSANAEVNVGFFYSSLSPHGEWIELNSGMYGWRPSHMQSGWRPYLYGRWVWTDFGWYWVSNEQFGWATYHYGRWYNDEYYGWIWIPDNVWGPSWVEWRYNDDYIGWAPLSPYASFSFSVGIRFTTRWIAPLHYWSFVRYRHFNAYNVDRYSSPPENTRRLIGSTRTSSHYEVDRDRIINNGVERSYVEQRGGGRIDRYDVGQSRDRGERMVRDIGGRERIEVYRPDTDPSANRDVRIEARRPERQVSLDFGRIERSVPERQSDVRANEVRGTRSEGETRTPSREPQREQVTPPQPTRGQEIDRNRNSEQQQRESIKELTDRRRKEFEQSRERSRIQLPQPFFERRQMMPERPTSRERVSPPQPNREAPRQAPERGKSGSSDQGRSRNEGAKRNR